MSRREDFCDHPIVTIDGETAMDFDDAVRVEDHLEELTRLADPAGAEVIGRTFQRIEAPTPNYFLGQGKVEELKGVLGAAGLQAAHVGSQPLDDVGREVAAEIGPLGLGQDRTLDMAAGFSTLANGGVRCRSFAIGRVVLPGGEKLYQHKPECRQVIDPDIAHLVTAMLQRVVCCGTGSAAQIGRPIAGKTGTAQDYTNVYFAGYTPQVATAVWVGFPEGQIPMDSYYGYSVFGGTVAAPIWQDFMVKAVSGMPVLGFPAPPPQPGGEIPNVVGLRSREAQEILVEANFTPIVEKVDSSVLVNTVLEQSPEGGATATLGNGVKLIVSNGKGDKGYEDGQPVLVPNVVGLAEKDAVDALKPAGLEADVQRIEVSDPNQDGIVQIQSPVAYQQVPAGSTVTIWVGQQAHGPGRARSP
jgi:membrane peptidoglycan carboxypeptidase